MVDHNTESLGQNVNLSSKGIGWSKSITLEGYATYPVTDYTRSTFSPSTERTIRWVEISPGSKTQRIDIAYTKTALSGFFLVAHSPQRWTNKVKCYRGSKISQRHTLWGASFLHTIYIYIYIQVHVLALLLWIRSKC